MKVLLVSPLPPPSGGIQSVTSTLVDFLRDRTSGVELLVCDTAHHLRPVTSGAVVVRVFTGIQNSVSTLWKVFWLLRRERPHVIHLASSASLAMLKDWIIESLARRFHVPVVMHWHFGRVPELKRKNNWEWKLILHIIRNSACSVIIDEPSFQMLREEGCQNVFYVPNPLSNEAEEAMRKWTENQQIRPAGRLLFVGHVIREKGVFELVQACKMVSSVEKLTVIGACEESLKRALLKIAGEKGGTEWLEFTGELDQRQVWQHMARSPVVVLPSYTEGFPMVVLEAMAMGCAVVATPVGAIPEMLAIGEEQVCGICVPVGDVDSLADAISFFVSNALVAAEWGKNGSRRVLQNYTMKSVFSRYLSVWESALICRQANSLVEIEKAE